MNLVEFSEQYAERYHRFIRRIAPTDNIQSDMPFGYYLESPDITIKRHLVIDEKSESAVVGAFDIKVQRYLVGGEIAKIAVVKYPVSLGIVDPKYATVGMYLFAKLNEVYPLNYLLGMGPPESSVVARLVEVMGWSLNPVPYFLLPMRLSPLVQLQFAGNSARDRFARVAAALGLFHIGDVVLRMAYFRPRRKGASIRVVPVTQFDASLDDFWREFSADIGFSLVRDSTEMNSIYPAAIPQFEKLTFYHGDRLIGFAVLLVPTSGNPRFSNTKTVTLVDANFLDSHLEEGTSALTRHFGQRGFDAVIVNNTHGKTIRCLKGLGFIERTTGVYLAMSKQLQALVERHDILLSDMIMTRGDGDGPIGLGVDL